MQLDDLIFARNVLAMRESDVFKTAVERISKRLFDDWQKTAPLDRDSRENSWALAHAVKLLIREFDAMASPAVLEREAKKREQGETTPLRRNSLTA